MKPNPGALKLHALLPISADTLFVKKFSTTNETQIHHFTVQQERVSLEEIKGFVTCVYNNFWWLGCVLNMNTDLQEVVVNFHHPHGPSPSFVYPKQSDILKCIQFCMVDPSTGMGRTYTLTSQESEEE
ncbi:hypothetical protein C0J52_03110 [Blattella germanica]|nr:hypothetical protein C0J52_03110 [Blattella germanica]